jgi:hypothetical protein
MFFLLPPGFFVAVIIMHWSFFRGMNLDMGKPIIFLIISFPLIFRCVDVYKFR